MKQKSAHDQNRFLNCLRIQSVHGYHEEQRIKNIVIFCKKYMFDNVILFINSEEYCTGHMTREEAKPWVETMKRAKEILHGKKSGMVACPMDENWLKYFLDFYEYLLQEFSQKLSGLKMISDCINTVLSLMADVFVSII